MQHRESLFPVAGSAALKPQAEIRHARIIAFPKQTPSDAPQQPRHAANSLRRFANASVRIIHCRNRNYNRTCRNPVLAFANINRRKRHIFSITIWCTLVIKGVKAHI